MNCHQWCECPKCTTHYDSCMNEIKNPHTGSFSESSESRIKDLEQKLTEAEKKILEYGYFKELVEKEFELDKAKLSEAMEVIRYYGDPKTYCTTKNVRPRIPWEKRLLVADDVEQTDIEIFPVGGKRARDFIKKHEVKNGNPS